MPVEIRTATIEDVDGVREVQHRTWLATYPNAKLGITEEDIESRFRESPEQASRYRRMLQQWISDDPLAYFWVATDGGRVVGFCRAMKDGGQNKIQAIYVLPEYQRQQIGKRLLERAFVWLGTQQDIFLDVASYNEQAISFYRSFGFVPSGDNGHSGAAALPSGAMIPEIELVRRGKESGVSRN